MADERATKLRKRIAEAAVVGVDIKAGADAARERIDANLRHDPNLKAYVINSTAQPLFAGFFVDKKGRARPDLVREAMRRFLDFLDRHGDVLDGVIAFVIKEVAKVVGQVHALLPNLETTLGWTKRAIPWIERTLDAVFPLISFAAKYLGRWLARAAYMIIEAAAVGPETAGVGSVASVTKTLGMGFARDAKELAQDLPALADVYKDKLLGLLPTNPFTAADAAPLARTAGSFMGTAVLIGEFVARGDEPWTSEAARKRRVAAALGPLLAVVEETDASLDRLCAVK